MRQFEDLSLEETRHPLIRELEGDIARDKPFNILHYIKLWAKKKLKEQRNSSEDETLEQTHKAQKDPEQKGTQKRVMKIPRRRRHAVIMSNADEDKQPGIQRDAYPKNEEIKSRIMIKLRSIPFLKSLSWQSINQLVSGAVVHQYNKDELVIKKGTRIRRLHMMLGGEVQQIQKEGSKRFLQGHSLCEQALISVIIAPCNYEVVSQQALICSLDVYALHMLAVRNNKDWIDRCQKILANVKLFTWLDDEEMGKLCNMIQQRQVKNDQTIVEVGQKTRCLYLILQGRFVMCRRSLSGETITFRTVTKGEFFGQEWLAEVSSESSFAVIAETAGMVGLIDRQDIENGLQWIPHLKQRVKR